MRTGDMQQGGATLAPRERLEGVLRELRAIEPSCSHEERVRLEGARQLIEDVVKREEGSPLPALYEPEAAAIRRSSYREYDAAGRWRITFEASGRRPGLGLAWVTVMASPAEGWVEVHEDDERFVLHGESWGGRLVFDPGVPGEPDAELERLVLEALRMSRNGTVRALAGEEVAHG